MAEPCKYLSRDIGLIASCESDPCPCALALFFGKEPTDEP